MGLARGVAIRHIFIVLRVLFGSVTHKSIALPLDDTVLEVCVKLVGAWLARSSGTLLWIELIGIISEHGVTLIGLLWRLVQTLSQLTLVLKIIARIKNVVFI